MALQYLKLGWLVRHLFLVVSLTAIGFAAFTIHVLQSGAAPFSGDIAQVLWLLLVDLVLLLALGVLIFWRFLGLWLERKRAAVGSRLQTRIILMFSLVSVVPTIVVVGFSILFFNQGIQSWFDERVSTALQESVKVAESYLNEHKMNIRGDVMAMANDLNQQADILLRSPMRFQQVATTQAALRDLREAIVFRPGNEILAKSELTFSLAFEVESLPSDYIRRASNNEVVIFTNPEGDRVRALIKLQSPVFNNTYLLVGRFIDSKVLDHMAMTQNSVNAYQQLRANISQVQVQFFSVFIAVAVLILLAAVWAGIIFAGDLVEPIIKLIKATERVKAGDMNVRVPEGPLNDESATLGRAFNRMTDQLQKQRRQLVEVNHQIDARRRLNEAVLSGVSAGVMALDKEQKITLYNRTLPKLLLLSDDELKGRFYYEVFKELQPLLAEADTAHGTMVQGEASIERNGKKASFLVRVVTEALSDSIEGYVVTIDDITELLAAQRSAAWADVARRIAHEIKNPLTPITLSLDRLQQKYRRQITNDPESFDKYLDTISRHVGNIGKIVEEFVQFARLPAPSLKKQDLGKLMAEAVTAQELVNPAIRFVQQFPVAPLCILADGGQMIQVFTNLLKNAREAIETRMESEPSLQGAIAMELHAEQGMAVLEISDNGTGFPEELLDRITEPYVTTRDKGTGLGLAIVKKVVIDHEGELVIQNRKTPSRYIEGAYIRLSFPLVS